MKPSLALAEHKDAIRQIVVRHRASNPRVFGSVVHGDDSEDSDLDLLVDPSPDSSLLDIACIQVEIEALTDFPNPGDSPVLREGLTPLKCLRFSLERRLAAKAFAGESIGGGAIRGEGAAPTGTGHCDPGELTETCLGGE